MTREQAAKIVRILEVAYPQSKKMREHDTLTVYASFLEPLDYDLAAAAVRDVIDVSKWWPAWSEIRAAYDGRLAQRKRQIRRDRAAAEEQEWDAIAPTDDERQAMLEQARAFLASWPTALTGQDGTGREPGRGGGSPSAPQDRT